jgi:hydrogenase-4 component F
MLFALIALPLLAAILVWYMRPGTFRAKTLPVVGVLHLSLALVCVWRMEPPAPDAWLKLDALGGWVLLVVSSIFAVTSFYVPTYLALQRERNYRGFCACLLGFLSMAGLVAASRHPGMFWVGMEAMALTTAPLVYCNRNRKSFEATWKYLMICGVGMALALLGTFFIAYAADVAGIGEPLYFDRLQQHAMSFQTQWLKTGFVFLLVGYGTMMGLAPLHTWKPDALGEAPGAASTALGAGVTACAFLAIARALAIMNAGGEGEFARRLLLLFGFVSTFWALAPTIKQSDLRRLLAYGGVGQVGTLAIGLGAGAIKPALYLLGAFAMTSATLFLAVENIHRAFGHKNVPEVSGAISRYPWTGWLFLIGFFASVCCPPFGPFLGAYQLAMSAFNGGRVWVGGLFLASLALAFLASSRAVFGAALGTENQSSGETPYRDKLCTVGPIAVALTAALLMGVWTPPQLSNLIERAAAIVSGL